jgi:D-lyxose ketol-isomerase
MGEESNERKQKEIRMMHPRQAIDRRSLLRAAGSAAGLAAIGAAAVAARAGKKTRSGKPSLHFENDAFYNREGKFLPEKGAEAIRTLLEHHGYPIFDGLMEELWVSDYGLGRFTELGLAAYIFMNQEKANYLQLDIYLLPNQMVPEHYHLKTEKCAPKMEGWLCRYGRAYAYGEGPRTENLHAKIPAFESQWVTVFHETVLDPGQCAHLNRPTARHWLFAGPESAVLTEVGTFHDNDGVRHTDPNIVFG